MSRLREEAGHSRRIPRVLFVDHSGGVGGGQMVLQEMLTHLKVDAHVMFLSHGPMLERLASAGLNAEVCEKAVRLVALAGDVSFVSRLWSLRYLPAIIRFIVKELRNADLIYVNSKKAIFPAVLASVWARRPLIWHQHDEMLKPSSLSLRGRVSESVLVWLLNQKAARIISVSQAAADTFIDAGGRKDLPVIIHNGVDPSRYSRLVDKSYLRHSLGLPSNKPVIGCFGRLTSWKGQSVLLDALSYLPDAHATFVGGTFFGEQGYELALREKVTRLRLEKRVHFVGHRDDVPDLMQVVDIIVHTSIAFEPFGLVIVEGMLSKRPVIATDTGGVSEILENGVSGLLVKPGDARELAGALAKLINNHDLACRLAAAGFEHACEKFPLKKAINRVSRVIADTVNISVDTE